MLRLDLKTYTIVNEVLLKGRGTIRSLSFGMAAQPIERSPPFNSYRILPDR
jgi:hypothetical protein